MALRTNWQSGNFIDMMILFICQLRCIQIEQKGNPEFKYTINLDMEDIDKILSEFEKVEFIKPQ